METGGLGQEFLINDGIRLHFVEYAQKKKLQQGIDRTNQFPFF